MLPPALLLPFFALIALGFLLGRGPLASATAQGGLRAFVLYAALPAFIFRFVAEAPPIPPAALLAPLVFAAALTITGATAWALAEQPRKRLVVMGAVNSNIGYMGLPAIAISPLGADPAATGAAIAILVFDVLVLLNTTIIVLTNGGLRAGVRAMVRLPLLWAMLAGIVVRYTGLALPLPVTTLLSLLAGGAVAGALITLGAALSGGGRANLAMLRPVWPALPAKLVLNPACYLVLATLLELPRGAILAGTILAATPTSLGYFLIAAAGGNDPRLPAALCLWTTIASLPTLAAWSTLLAQ